MTKNESKEKEWSMVALFRPSKNRTFVRQETSRVPCSCSCHAVPCHVPSRRLVDVVQHQGNVGERNRKGVVRSAVRVVAFVALSFCRVLWLACSQVLKSPKVKVPPCKGNAMDFFRRRRKEKKKRRNNTFPPCTRWV